MKGQLETVYGSIYVDTDVIAAYTGSVAVSCFGIVGMSAYNMKDGLFHILKKDSLKYGINVKVDNNEILLTVHCIMAYGVSILTVSENLLLVAPEKDKTAVSVPKGLTDIFDLQNRFAHSQSSFGHMVQ